MQFIPTRSPIITGFVTLILCISTMQSGQANPLRPPDPDDNKIRLTCIAQISNLYHVVKEHQPDMSQQLFQMVSSMLMAAEIDSQLNSFPSCFNKLHRAKQLLIQSNYEVPPLPEKNGR